jgi:polyhydroxybutyrate depolymerase
MRRIAVLAACLVACQLWATGALACGGLRAPCEVAGGRYHILVPGGSGPFPVVMYLHGSYGQGRGVLRNPLMATFLRRGYVLVAPTGPVIRYGPNSEGTGWRYGNGADQAFLSAVLDDVAARIRIDETRILAAGYSMGGVFLYHAACEGFDDRIRHFAVLAAGFETGDPGRCIGRDARFSLLHVHGRADTSVPIEGGAPGNRGKGWESLDSTLDILTGGEGCTGMVPSRDGAVDALDYIGCRDGQRYRLAMHDGDHKIPPVFPDLALDWFEAAH